MLFYKKNKEKKLYFEKKVFGKNYIFIMKTIKIEQILLFSQYGKK